MTEVLIENEELLLPVRMLNEYTYCSRLGYLEWVEGEFRDSADTLEGTQRHRRVDKERVRAKPKDREAADLPEKIHERSVSLSSETLGLTAKIDLVEKTGDRATPVDYKRGKRPHIDKGAYEPERVQLCAQGLLLRENGYNCDEGFIFYCESRDRVAVSFDSELTDRTVQLANEFRSVAREGVIPPPLEDSPKCPRCSLVGICLPDELRCLKLAAGDVRPLFASGNDALPVHIQHQGARVKKDGAILKVLDHDEVLHECRLYETSQVVLYGGVQISTQTVQELCQRGIPLCYLSHGGWFYGITHGVGSKNIELRRRQFSLAEDPGFCLRISRRFVQAKIANCRTMLRRNHAEPTEKVLSALQGDIKKAGRAAGLDTLLGIEGTAAHRYFENFSGMLKTRGDNQIPFDFSQRNRRPPKDPVNAMLSFAYAMLTREMTVVLLAVGFDPYLGFYHQPRYGRSSLALDLMEEFRPLIADSVVLTAINNGEVGTDDFIVAMGSVALSESGRRRFIGAFERRMSYEITHPLFKYKVSYRQVLELQARLLGRFLMGEIGDYPAFVTR